MASSLRACAAVLAAGFLFASPAAAQKGDPPPPTQPPPAPPPAARGLAKGARPARPFVRPPPKRAAWVRGKRVRDLPVVSGLPIASFPGFSRLDDGKSRIFVEVGAKVDVAERRDPARIVYRLRGTAVTQATNALPLLTSYFSTPVERVQLVQDGGDVDVIIDLREPSEAAFQVVETPRGMVLWVDFPRSINFGKDDPSAVEVDAPNTSGRRSMQTQRLGHVDTPSADPAPAPAPVMVVPANSN
jgi:hypothetical protein